jgi:hypothetical protein
MSDSNEKKRKNYTVDIVCHNLKSFDSHIIIAHFKRIAAGLNKNGSYRDIEVIAVRTANDTFRSNLTVFASSILFSFYHLLLINLWQTVPLMDMINLSKCKDG